MVSLVRPFLTVIGVMISTLSLNIFGVLLWLFVRLWNRPLYRTLLGRFALTRWLETTTLLLPDTRYVLYGDPLNVHMAKAATTIPELVLSNGTIDASASLENLAAQGQSATQVTSISAAAAPSGNAACMSLFFMFFMDRSLQVFFVFEFLFLFSLFLLSRLFFFTTATTSVPTAGAAAAAVADGKKPSPLSILVCNHQVDLDWLYLWEAARYYGAHSTLKVILKEALKYVPLLGFAMTLLEFLFLKRDWESDRANLQRRLASFARDRVPVLLILFPEGTTVNTRALEKSHGYSREKARPHLDLLLLPRTTGFEACLKSLGKGNHTVYDVTMAFSGYTGEVPTYEMGYERARDKGIPNAGKVLKGCKAEVHLDVRAIPTSEILDKYDTVEKWLDERWVRKERLMKYFAEHQCFPVEEVGPSQTAVLRGKFSSMVELWLVVALSVVILPFALMLFIPYGLVVALSYSYIKWHEYTQIMLSREERHDYRKTVQNSVLKGVALFFLVGTGVAWAYTLYSLIFHVFLPAAVNLFS